MKILLYFVLLKITTNIVRVRELTNIWTILPVLFFSPAIFGIFLITRLLMGGINEKVSKNYEQMRFAAATGTHFEVI